MQRGAALSLFSGVRGDDTPALFGARRAQAQQWSLQSQFGGASAAAAAPASQQATVLPTMPALPAKFHEPDSAGDAPGGPPRASQVPNLAGQMGGLAQDQRCAATPSCALVAALAPAPANPQVLSCGCNRVRRGGSGYQPTYIVSTARRAATQAASASRWGDARPRRPMCVRAPCV